MDSYCPPNVSLSTAWLDDGWSHCFLDTVSSATITGFLLVFGTIQLVIYHKYAIPNEDVRPSRLYVVQMLLHVFVPVLAVIRLFLQATAYGSAPKIYGYMVIGQTIKHSLNLIKQISNTGTRSSRHLCSVCVCHLSCHQGASLSVTIDTYTWPRTGVARHMVVTVYCRESDTDEYGVERMAGFLDHAEQGGDADVWPAICRLSLYICDGSEGAWNRTAHQ